MSTTSPRGLWYRVLVITGGTALLTAMVVDTLAVIGRHTGIPLLGSIELVQAVVAIASATAMIVATLNGSHAVVRLITDRLPERQAAWFARVNALLAALFFCALLAGSVWITSDLWFGFEETELWRIPYRPLRVLVCICAFCVALIFAWHALRGRKR
ncbi:MAG: TRAP transporter small permease [Gammaproteobacteria bacterium]|nr:TRAP transporter small permease [Gammaproteobacteria bacterium]